eukprot:g42013.t1
MGVFNDPNWVFCPECASPKPQYVICCHRGGHLKGRRTPPPSSKRRKTAAKTVASTAAAAEAVATTAAVEAAPHVQSTEYGEEDLANIQILRRMHIQILRPLSLAFWDAQFYAWKAADKAEEKARAAAATASPAAASQAAGAPFYFVCRAQSDGQSNVIDGLSVTMLNVPVILRNSAEGFSSRVECQDDPLHCSSTVLPARLPRYLFHGPQT